MFQTTNQISYVKVLIHASPDLTKILRVSKMLSCVANKTMMLNGFVLT